MNRCASDDSLIMLVEGIRRHPSLRFLSLTIDDCQTITEGSLALLGKIFKRLKFLEKLELSFIKIDSAQFWIKNMRKYLEKLGSLKSISLNFTSCMRIKDEDLNDLVECFKKLDSVKEIGLNLNSYLENIDFKSKSLM